MNEYDLDYARNQVVALQWRTRMARRLMDSMHETMTPAEMKTAETVGVASTYEALRYLDEQVVELLAEFDAARGARTEGGTEAEEDRHWAVLLGEWRDCMRAARWIDRTTDRQLEMGQASGLREPLLDKMVLLASSTEVIRVLTKELQAVLGAVFLTGSPTVPVEPDPIDPGVEPPPDEPVEPVPIDPGEIGPIPVPPGVNPIVFALDQAREFYELTARRKVEDLTAEEEIDVYLVPGRYKGVDIGGTTWAPIPRYKPWWGKARLNLHGAGVDETTIVAVNDEGWGASFAIHPTPDWDGRLCVYDLTIECSGTNAIEGGAFGTQEKRPLKQLEFHGIHIVDHPNPAVRCIRPVSLNQACVRFYESEWRCPNSREHAVYRRNGLGVSGMFNCRVDGIGAQIWQDVARPTEGPSYGRGTVELVDCDFRNFHLDAGRAGSAVTQAGSGCDFLVKGCTISDVQRDPANPPASGPRSFGGHVTWAERFYPIPSGRANYSTVYQSTDIVLKDAGRSIAAFDSVDEVRASDCGFYSSNGKPITVGTTREDSVGQALFQGCNTPEVRERCRAKGFFDGELVGADLLWGPERRNAGPLASFDSWAWPLPV